MSDHQPPSASPSPAGTARRFRKKPVVIDAFQWNPVAKGVPGERHPAWDALDAWLVSLGYKTMDEADDDDDCPMWLNGDESITIPTLEGDMRCDIGDWIIRGVKGEFYPCKPDIFALTYEPAPSSAPPAPRHVCGVAGFDGMQGDVCPACSPPTPLPPADRRAFDAIVAGLPGRVVDPAPSAEARPEPTPTRESTMTTQTPLAADDPLMLAWKAYAATDEYANTKRWAIHPEHVEGSLWAAFVAGTRAPVPASASPTEGVPTRVTRFELIDHRERVGFHRRSFVANTCAIELSYQDGGRTLKVFVNDPAPASADARP